MTMPDSDRSPLSRIRADVQAMHAYVVQNSDGMIKLDAMENPHRLSAELQTELGQRLGAVALNRYPGARINDLINALKRHVALPERYALMLGNGSDELISLLALACAVPPCVAENVFKVPKIRFPPLVTVLRPAALVGQGVDTMITRHFEAPRLLTVRGAVREWQFVHIEDLASAET